MRTLALTLTFGVTVFVGALGFTPGEAQAYPTATVLWTACTGCAPQTLGLNTIQAAPGSVLTASVFLTATDDGPKIPDFPSESDGIGGYALTALFDTDFGNELTFVSGTKLVPAGFDTSPGVLSLAAESTGGVAGEILNAATAFGTGVGAGQFLVATLVFSVTANVTDDAGPDLVMGAFNAPPDGVTSITPIDNITSTVTFNGASVNIPEPGTLSLLALGLLGLGTAFRGRL